MLFAGPAAAADVLNPHAIFYGVVGIGATPVSATDDLTVVARLDGRDTPIVAYHMGAQPVVGEADPTLLEEQKT